MMAFLPLSFSWILYSRGLMKQVFLVSWRAERKVFLTEGKRLGPRWDRRERTGGCRQESRYIYLRVKTSAARV